LGIREGKKVTFQSYSLFLRRLFPPKRKGWVRPFSNLLPKNLIGGWGKSPELFLQGNFPGTWGLDLEGKMGGNYFPNSFIENFGAFKGGIWIHWRALLDWAGVIRFLVQDWGGRNYCSKIGLWWKVGRNGI